MSGRTRTTLIVVAAAVVVLALSLRALARAYTDYLWFQSLGFSTVWRDLLGSKVLLAIVFTVVFFVLAYANLALADRLDANVDDPDDELLARYREFVDPRRRLFRIGVCGVLALVAGAGASGQWNNWVLFRHGGSFGRTDPLLGKDVGFYVFQLPFLSYCASWAFAALTIVLLATAVTHYLGGALRLSAPAARVLPGARAHLAVLLAATAVLKALDYWLSRYELTLSDRGVVDGALYTDVHAQLPATQLLIAISLCSAVLLLLSLRTKSLTLPIVAVGSWLLVAIMAGELYPWFVQRFQVKPKESAREAEYIARNIEATRTAMGLDQVVQKTFDYVDQPSDAEVEANEDTVRNIRLLDPNVVLPAFQNLEGEVDYYQFKDLDADRYSIDGRQTEVVIGVRELDPSKIPQDTWESRHLIYTHGYGAAIAPANAVASNGSPSFVLGGVPARAGAPSALQLTRGEVYVGEGIDGTAEDGYAIVGTGRKEQTAPGVETVYEGTGGVRVDGFFRKAAFALRFGELDPLISDFVTSDSRVLYQRDVAGRVREVAPFLALDHDPYPVVSEGRIKWVLDAYTTSSSYPYGQDADTRSLDEGSDLKARTFNYIRNSVKAVVDAYDGTVSLYLSDSLYSQGEDPIIRSYAEAFPELFQPIDDMPEDVRSHLRYPEDLFKIQTQMWGRYHVEDPGQFYTRNDNWDIAQDPGKKIDEKPDPAGPRRVAPYYQLMRTPEQESLGFLVFRPFVPFSEEGAKKELTAFMVGQSDPDRYGRLEVFTMTKKLASGERERNRSVAGPLIVDSNIKGSTNGAVSQTLTLLNAGGSKVEFGNMLIIPIAESLVYIRPTYVSATNNESVPELRSVIVATGKRVEVGRTLAEALGKLFPDANVATLEGAAPPTTPGSGSTPTAEDELPAALLTRAIGLFDEADRALKEGGATGLATYQTKTAEAQELIRRASVGLGSELPTTSTTSTVPGAG